MTKTIAIKRVSRPQSKIVALAPRDITLEAGSSFDRVLSCKRVYVPLTAVIAAPFIGEAVPLNNVETNSLPCSINTHYHAQ